jgi:hypothetical protein
MDGGSTMVQVYPSERRAVKMRLYGSRKNTLVWMILASWGWNLLMLVGYGGLGLIVLVV